jgi:FtsP/CotA-like multicopper oxidase with cupredoxin domain
VLQVAPAAYRFKILSAGNDRSWHLSWFVADATQGNTEVAMVPAAPPSAGSAIPLCGPVNPVAVPSLGIGLDTGILNASGNPLNGTGLPASCWPNYGPVSGIPPGQTMWAADGRAGGVPDPRNAGPAWIQIGSEGGLLPKPVVIPATPVNYEQNPRSITITSVGVHGLWLGPAERADVIVDFSAFSGKTLILYNDAPTPAPAYDTRLDYFTGDGDQTDIGGAPNTLAGYGPNTRTIMQVVVTGSNPNPVPFSLPKLTAAFASNGTSAPGVYAATQPTSIVAEPQYNTAYNGIYPNQTKNQQVGISDTTMSFTPYVPQTFNNPCGTTCDNMDEKTIQELFTVDYGKLNATLGTELPNVNFQNQTTVPLNYVDPATEILRPGDTQLWKITHNGVDTHFIHFHLYNVQVINRVGWDGSMRPIDANEYGWKDTVRMNPLEDITVALQPITPPLPFPLANSVRLMDVTSAAGVSSNPPFSLLDPYTNGAATTVNEVQNFGWEYVWHCHILGHEENDMMRAQIFQVPPPAPSKLTVAAVGVNATITFTDNSASETGFTIERSTDSTFQNPAPTIIAAPASPTRNQAGEGTDWGSTIKVSDTLPDTVNTYFYRVQAVDDGWLGGMSQTYNSWVLGTSAVCNMPSNGAAPIAVGKCPLLSGWSNTAQAQSLPVAGVSPTSLAFGNQLINTTSAPQSVTLSNTGSGTLNINSISITGANAADFLQAGTTCGVTLAPSATCTISVTFKPLVTGPLAAAITIASNDPVNPTLTVTLTGTGTAPIAGVAPTSLAFGNQLIHTTSSPAMTATLSNTGTAPLTVTSIAASGGNSGDFAVSSNCGGSVAIGGSCTISVTFTPAATGARASAVVITSNDPVNPTLSVSLTGTGTAPIAGVAPTTLAFGNQVVGTTSGAMTTTLSNTGTAPLTVNSILATGTNAGDFVVTNNCGGSVAIGGSCTISVKFAPTATGARSASISISSNDSLHSPLTVSLTGTGILIGVNPSAAGFGALNVGVTSSPQTVTLTNNTTNLLMISSFSITGANPSDFAQLNNCSGSRLAAGTSCTITIRFTPGAAGARSATLTVIGNGPNNPTVALSGTGITNNPAATVSSTSLIFGPQTIGTQSAAQTVILSNTGTVRLTVLTYTFGGTNAADFIQNNNCSGGVLNVGASCTIYVRFRPQAGPTGPRGPATLTVNNSQGATATVTSITGTAR